MSGGGEPIEPMSLLLSSIWYWLSEFFLELLFWDATGSAFDGFGGFNASLKDCLAMRSYKEIMEDCCFDE